MRASERGRDALRGTNLKTLSHASAVCGVFVPTTQMLVNAFFKPQKKRGAKEEK